MKAYEPLINGDLAQLKAELQKRMAQCPKGNFTIPVDARLLEKLLQGYSFEREGES